jgi:multicomponent Na+:H+ antiporter subunit D
VAELLLHPALPLLVGALVVWFVPRRVGHVVMVAAPLAALGLVARLEVGTTVPLTYLGFELEVVRADPLAMPFAWVFAIAALLAGIYGLRTMHARERTAALVYAGAAMGVVFAGDLLTLFFFWEIKAVASTFVILARRGGNAGRAGTRYLFAHLVGGKVLLAGALWYLADTGSLAFDAMTLTPATTLILLAVLLSAAVPPLHAWLPDAYPEASVAGTVFLSAFTTKAAVYALARGFPGTQLLIYLGIFMALYGVVYAVLENDTRRLLGYHIISQVGYMVAGVGIGTEAAINGATAHAFAHILYKGLLLMGAGAVIYATGRSKMSELGGIAHRMRAALLLYLVGAVSISSVPLFSGFVSKELVVDAASQAGDLGWLVLLLKVASVGTFLHTGLKLPYGAWFGTEGWGPRDNTGHRIQVGPVAPSMYVAMSIAAVLNTAIGIFPRLLYDLLPYPVDYDPYTLGKVIEKSSILLFTALAFWVLLDQLGAKAMVSVDTDWLYRRLPRLVGDGIGRRRGAVGAPVPSPTEPVPTAPAPIPEEIAGVAPGSVPARPTAVGVLTRAGTVVASRVAGDDRDGPPPVVATWLLGSVILATAIVILTVSLTS